MYVSIHGGKEQIHRVHEDNKTFECYICSDSLKSKMTLNDHIRRVHREKSKYQCDFCNASYSQHGKLNMHVAKVHEGMKFQCKQCDYSVTEKSLLSSHVKSVHEGDLIIGIWIFITKICYNVINELYFETEQKFREFFFLFQGWIESPKALFEAF